MVTLTSDAANKIKEFCQKEGKSANTLRLKVVSGGCSGLSYEFEFSDAASATDKAFEKDGARLIMDYGSYMHVAGSEVDYVSTLMKSGFEVRNPQAKSVCSCGVSFNV